MKAKAVVIGGGFTGLVTSYYLAKAHYQVVLYEKSDRLGGLISTEQLSWGFVEAAAHGLMSSKDLHELLEDLKLDFIFPKEKNRKRFIYRGRPRTWPLSWLESFSLMAKVFCLLKNQQKRKPTAKQSVREWGGKHLSPLVVDYVLEPGLSGIYAGRASELSASLTLGPVLSREKKSTYGGTISFKKGMGELIEALKQKLQKLGVKIHFNSEYQVPLELSEPHFICTGALEAAHLLKDSYSRLACRLSQIDYLPLVTVTAEFTDHPLSGFGCLFPQKENLNSLGVLLNTDIFTGRATENYTETWILGGAFNQSICNDSEELIRDKILSDRQKVFSSHQKPTNYKMTYWPQAVPYYNIYLEEFLLDLDEELSQKLDQKLGHYSNLHLNGNYLGAIGLSKIITQSKNKVNQL